MSSIFTPVYKKAKEVLTAQKFAEPEWQKFLAETCGATKLLGPSGFDPAYAGGLDSIRNKIKGDSKHTNSVAIFFLGGGPGEVIYDAAQNKSSGGSWNDRAATLKLLRHVYRARKTGGQDVWVYSPPKDHGKQIFDELAGADSSQAKKKLGQESEIFSQEERGLMCDALQLARKIAMDCSTKLGAKSFGAKSAVRRWFMDDKCTKTELDEALGTLADGMNKIAAACGSSSLVFTDYLDWRKQRDDYFGGAIRGGEGGGFPVIYLEGAFARLKGNSGKLWLCAETIIHELSHHELRTQDHRYDYRGLKPDSGSFPYAKAIENADSWGYFAVDLAGYLSQTDRMGTRVDDGPEIPEAAPTRKVA
jgi:hypothetical protein